MAQFQVPQFIEIEQKLIAGRLTLKQFVLVCAGLLVVFGLFYVLNFVVWLILTTIIFSLIGALGFLKIGGRPVSGILKAAFFYYWNPTFYLWQSDEAAEISVPVIETKIHRAHEEKNEEEYIKPQIPREFTVRPDVKIPSFTPPTPTIRKPVTGQSNVPKESGQTPYPYAARDREEAPITGSRHVLPLSKKVRERLSRGREVQTLWEKISTSKLALPKRERAINFFLKNKAQEGYQVLRDASGKMEVAKRVDFK